MAFLCETVALQSKEGFQIEVMMYFNNALMEDICLQWDLNTFVCFAE